MRSIGHPLVSDKGYAANWFAADRIWCSRIFLHKYHLAFLNVPQDGDVNSHKSRAEVGVPDDARSTGAEGLDSKREHVYCPLPEDLRMALAVLTAAENHSEAPLAAWLSGDVARMISFEQHSDARHAVAKRSVTAAECDSAGYEIQGKQQVEQLLEQRKKLRTVA
eukprot:gnl/TRDRNA2_/TRDRNA2_171782_c3_seq1.p1 gnl/TRDRNA2_/TRDRNA2_171782_c3~~gnl/TRDRNA2_/TRDRNA2_171782_c3_seq1.p1  ORF type:complete len:165 (-),score=29.06 gnl/TRDRNA2_/TRDRNA2_171782_c3_seq1:61-555(-)